MNAPAAVPGPGRILGIPTGSEIRRGVLAYLAAHTDAAECCWVLNVSAQTGFSPSRTYKHLKWMARRGWVDEEHESVWFPDFAAVAGRPEKVLYRITADGHRQLVDAMRHPVALPRWWPTLYRAAGVGSRPCGARVRGVAPLVHCYRTIGQARASGNAS